MRSKPYKIKEKEVKDGKLSPMSVLSRRFTYKFSGGYTTRAEAYLTIFKRWKKLAVKIFKRRSLNRRITLFCKKCERIEAKKIKKIQGNISCPKCDEGKLTLRPKKGRNSILSQMELNSIQSMWGKKGLITISQLNSIPEHYRRFLKEYGNKKEEEFYTELLKEFIRYGFLRGIEGVGKKRIKDIIRSDKFKTLKDIKRIKKEGGKELRIELMDIKGIGPKISKRITNHFEDPFPLTEITNKSQKRMRRKH